MEMYENEIELWGLIQAIIRRKKFIISTTLILTLCTFLISSFVITEKYESEMWLKINNDFFHSKNYYNILKTYSVNPEILNTVKLGEKAEPFVKENITYNEVGELIQVVYIHSESTQIPSSMKKWMQFTKTRLIIDNSKGLIRRLENELNFVYVSLSLLEKKHQNLTQLIDLEGKYAEVEVLPKEVPNEVITFKELNPNYLELKKEANQVQLKIDELRNQQLFMEHLRDNFNDLLSELKKIHSQTSNSMLDQLKTKLSAVEEDYNAYLLQIEGSEKRSLEPFDIVLAPYTDQDSVSPNVLLNTIWGAVIGLIIGLFYSLFMEYYHEMSERSLTQNSSKKVTP